MSKQEIKQDQFLKLAKNSIDFVTGGDFQIAAVELESQIILHFENWGSLPLVEYTVGEGVEKRVITVDQFHVESIGKLIDHLTIGILERAIEKEQLGYVGALLVLSGVDIQPHKKEVIKETILAPFMRDGTYWMIEPYRDFLECGLLFWVMRINELIVDGGRVPICLELKATCTSLEEFLHESYLAKSVLFDVGQIGCMKESSAWINANFIGSNIERVLYAGYRRSLLLVA